MEGWIDYPTETGWWWSRKTNEKPEMCCIVNKPYISGDQCAIALFPEAGYKRYLDAIYPNITYQKVKPFDE